MVMSLSEESHGPCCFSLDRLHSIPRGLLKFLILRSLEDKDLSGSQLMQIFEKSTHGKWRPSPGSIYPILKSLEEEGIITTVRIEGRSKVYSLTDKGRQILKQAMRKKAFKPRAQLGRMLWFHLFEPVDRLEFQIAGITSTIEELKESVDTLSRTKKKRVVQRIDGLITKLKELQILYGGDKE